jgi:hypothetical protein
MPFFRTLKPNWSGKLDKVHKWEKVPYKMEKSGLVLRDELGRKYLMVFTSTNGIH